MNRILLAALLVSSLLGAGRASAAPSSSSPNPRKENEVSGVPFLRNFSPKEYQAHPQNWAVVQDRRGMIYVGNNDGVLEYDGIRWRLIPTRNKTTVRSLAVDATGRVYVAAQGEFGYLAPDAKGCLGFVPLEDRLEAGDRTSRDLGRTHVIGQDVFFASSDRLYRFSGNRIRIWKPATAFGRSFALGERFFIREQDRGLLELEGDTLRLVPGGERFAREGVFALLPWEEPGAPAWKGFLVGTRSHGLFLHDGKGFTPFPTAADTFLRKNLIHHGTRLSDGSLALATLQGVVLLDIRGNVLQILGKHAGLQNSSVKYLFPDSHSGLWAALEIGISRIETPSPLSQFDVRSGLEGAVYTLFRHGGFLYAGTSLGAFYLEAGDGAKDPKGRLPTFRALQGIKDQTWAFLPMGDSLLSANNAGVYEIRKDKARRIRPAAGISVCLHPSAADPSRVYVGLQDGLAILQRKGEQGPWVHVEEIRGVNGTVRSIAEDVQGRVWLGTYAQGVLRVTLPKGKDSSSARPDPILEYFDVRHGLPSPNDNNVQSIGGALLFATRNGIYGFDAVANRFRPDPRFEHLFPGGARWVGDFIDDALGRIWMSTLDESKGLFECGAAWPMPDGTYRWEKTPFLRLDGFHVEEIFPEKDGVIWFGGWDGISRFDPSVPKIHTQDYSALVRRVSTAGNRLLYGGARHSGAPPEEAVLGFTENALHFEFALPAFDHASAVRYQVLLEGCDKEYSPWMAEAFKDYTNLAPGRYRFRVRAMNMFEQLSAEDVFRFRIQRPWWMTVWAKSLAVLVLTVPTIGLICWVVFRSRLRKLALYNAVLSERNRMAQDLHDGVGQGLSGVVFLLQGAQADAEAAGHPALDLVNRALEAATDALKEARDTFHALRPTPVEGGLQEALTRLYRRSEQGIRVILAFKGRPRPLPVPVEHHLHRIAEEALANVLRHSGASEIHVALAWTWRSVRLSVRDNGRGFAVGPEKRPLEGFGLQGMHDRVQEMGGRLVVSSDPGAGTEIRIEVPVPFWASIKTSSRRG